MKTSLERRLIAVRGTLGITPFRLFEEVLGTPPKEICVSTTAAGAAKSNRYGGDVIRVA